MRKHGTIEQAAGTEWSQLTLNGARGPLKDVNVRRAVAHAINRDEIADTVSGEFGLDGVTMGSVVYVPGQRGYSDSSAGLAFDPTEAKRLLAKAGYAAGPNGVRARKGKEPKLTPGKPYVVEATFSLNTPSGFGSSDGLLLFRQMVDDSGKPFEGVCAGNLCIDYSWPGQMRGVYGDDKKERFFNTYFAQCPGKYFTGGGCRRDKDGYYQITGRIDDVINVSGHRMGTAEVESALVAHKAVAEAAVVGMPHDIKGQGIYAYVTLKTGVEKSDALKKELVAHVRTVIGPIATPDKIQWADGLPKTRSGKIMRRILKKVAANDLGNLGDTSTLADPSVVDDIVKNRL
mgnify:CR=1 FL=1